MKPERYVNLFDAMAARDWKGAQGFEPELGESTEAPQGSPEKLRILAERVRRGEELFHPDDFQPEEK